MHLAEIENAVKRVIENGWYLRGTETTNFEKEYAKYIGTAHCVACGNGLGALNLLLRAYKELGKLHDGDEIIVPANTFIATILSITENNLVPVLTEPSIETYNIDGNEIEKKLSPKTKAVLIVHLYGRCSYTEKIQNICAKNDLLLIEDNAQAAGCTGTDGRKTGNLGDGGAHSFYPSKNIGALGDAGAVTTNDRTLEETVRALANYGAKKKYVFDYRGLNNRMDELQAAILSVKLKYLDEENHKRKEIARQYSEGINNPGIQLPTDNKQDNVWHIFPVLSKDREKLISHLEEKGIETAIHYPIPPHQQVCYKDWNGISFPVTEQIHREEVSIPCNQTMTKEEVERVIEAMNEFGKKK